MGKGKTDVSINDGKEWEVDGTVAGLVGDVFTALNRAMNEAVSECRRRLRVLEEHSELGIETQSAASRTMQSFFALYEITDRTLDALLEHLGLSAPMSPDGKVAITKNTKKKK